MLTEFVDEKIGNKINVIILTERCPTDVDGLYPSAKKVKEACESRGFPFYPILIPGPKFVSDLDQDSPNIIIRNVKTNKVIELDPKNTVTIIRGSVIHDQSISSLLTYLESKNVFVINKIDAITRCANKYNTTVALKVAGVPVPRTCLINNIKELDGALQKIGNNFPVVLKTLRGSAGIGVSKIDSKESLIGVLQSLWKHRAQLLLQEFLSCDFDVRTIVLDGKIISVMRRDKISGDFRSNFSLGGEVETYELTDDEKKIVLDSAKVCGTYFCGVDHMVVDGMPYVIEVNASPGSKGMQKATGINIIEILMNHIADRNNWKVQSSEIGYLEKIKFPELNLKVDATADSGNGMFNVLGAKHIKVTGDKVTFQIDGNKIEKKLAGTVEVNVGGVRNFIEKRPIVKFDVEFNGVKLKDITFTLDNRPSNLTPVLLCREFLVDLGVNINPKLKFSLGESHSFKDIRKLLI